MSDASLLDRILEPGSLSARFQPVLETRGGQVRTHYFEGLIRGPEGTSVDTPGILFEYARRKSKESAVDRACVATILQAAAPLLGGETLAINVHASTLAMDPSFVPFLADRLAAHRFPARRLVVEVVEHAPPWDLVGFRAAIARLRDLGTRVALDDVGLGHSNFMMILECRPDYFKVDRHLVTGCHADLHRRAVLRSLAQLAGPFDARVVAEGVEDAAELAALESLGIHFVQGYLFGRPVPAAELAVAGLGPGCAGRPSLAEVQARR